MVMVRKSRDFPSFSEGLSLRGEYGAHPKESSALFPFLFGGTFIEGQGMQANVIMGWRFPFLFGGTFIEGQG